MGTRSDAGNILKEEEEEEEDRGREARPKGCCDKGSSEEGEGGAVVDQWKGLRSAGGGGLIADREISLVSSSVIKGGEGGGVGTRRGEA